MPSCIVKSCKNASDKPETRHGFSFHKFPREPILRAKWVNIIRKTRDDENWSPSMHCVVCSAHFEEKYLYNTKSGLRRVARKAVPTKNLFVSTNVPIDIDTSDQWQHPTDERLSSPKSKPASSHCDSQTKPADDSLPTNTSSQPDISIEYDFPQIFVKVEPMDPTSEDIENVNNSQENDINIREEKSAKESTKLPIKKSIRRKLKTLQQKVRRLKKRNTLLKDLLKELLEKHLINVVDTQKLMSENAVLTGLLRSVHMRPTDENKLAPVPTATAEDDNDEQ